MADKAFVIEKLGWYIGKGFLHDPKVKLRTLALFLQENGLATRQLVDPALDLADDFQISSADVTERGLRFLKGGYQKWIKSIDRGRDPADDSLLKRELEKLG